MKARARRSNGCWTCKLRRKKCDERPGSCFACENLGVPCYGYARKPDWMDGGESEKAKVIEIRAIVKTKNDSMRQSRALKALSRRVQEPAPEKESIRRPLEEENAISSISSPSMLSSRNDREEQDTQMEDTFSDEWQFAHYVEHVIPLQLPFYSFQPGGDSQLWLRAFWNQPKPLCSAIRSLGMYYRYIKPEERTEKYDVVIGFLESCAKTLSEEGHPETDLMCYLKDIVQLYLGLLNILIDGIRGGGQEPQSSPCVTTMQRTLGDKPQMIDSSGNVTGQSSGLQSHSGTDLPVLRISSINNSTLELFSGVVLWIDILSCASTGLGPQHPELCAAALGGGEHSKIQLGPLMGCDNWAMLLIREIAALKVDKDRCSEEPEPDRSRAALQARADDIKQRLEAGDKRCGRSYWELSEGRRLPSPANEAAIIPASVIFALSALIYLQVSVYGCAPDAMGPVQELLFRWMLNVRFLPDAQPLPNLAWPICIAGCMATTPSQERFFRGVMARPPGVQQQVQGRGDRSLRLGLEVMELCWERRRAEGKESLGWDWARAMREQGRVVLLV